MIEKNIPVSTVTRSTEQPLPDHTDPSSVSFSNIGERVWDMLVLLAANCLLLDFYSLYTDCTSFVRTVE